MFLSDNRSLPQRVKRLPRALEMVLLNGLADDFHHRILRDKSFVGKRAIRAIVVAAERDCAGVEPLIGSVLDIFFAHVATNAV